MAYIVNRISTGLVSVRRRYSVVSTTASSTCRYFKALLSLFGLFRVWGVGVIVSIWVQNLINLGPKITAFHAVYTQGVEIMFPCPPPPKSLMITRGLGEKVPVSDHLHCHFRSLDQKKAFVRPSGEQAYPFDCPGAVQCDSGIGTGRGMWFEHRRLSM